MEATHHPTLSEVKQWLCDNGYEETVVFENPDYASAFLGVSEDGRAIYDYDLMVQHLVNTDGMEPEEAMEFIDYNTIGSLPYAGEKAPVVMYKMERM